ncbi:MAG: murein L,D-transpeptidase catalytic domain family protein [Dysgonomonas sp.]
MPEGDEPVVTPGQPSPEKALFDDMNLDGIVSFDAFEQAMSGYEKINVRNKDIITVIDFTKPSTEKRLFVLDLKHKKLLYSSLVAHGKNSGENYATSFSNTNESHQSSLGFYVTENTYIGKNGYSLILDGLEKGINDNAKARAIVMHGADYCSRSFIASSGRLGRSFGCPALPRELNIPIINTIKNGTLLFIYSANETYLANSPVLSSRHRA